MPLKLKVFVFTCIMTHWLLKLGGHSLAKWAKRSDLARAAGVSIKT